MDRCFQVWITALILSILLWLFILEHVKFDGVIMGTFYDICPIWISALSALEDFHFKTVKSLGPLFNMDCCFAWFGNYSGLSYLFKLEAWCQLLCEEIHQRRRVWILTT